MGKWEKLYVTHMAKDFCLYKVIFQIEKKFKTYQRAKWHRQKTPKRKPEEILEKKRSIPIVGRCKLE